MNFLKSILSLAFICFSIGVQSQIISITENDRGDKRSISLNEKQIIDINSRLEVRVSKTILLDAIKNQFPELKKQTDLESKLIILQQALRNQGAVISILEKQLATTGEQKSFFEIMEAFLTEVQADPFLSERYETLTGEFFKTEAFLSGNAMTSEPYILLNLNGDLLQIKNELESMEVDKYLVSVVAYKKDRLGGDRVHIQNYDNFSERDYVTIPRWVTSLSNEQKEKFKELTEIAGQLNAKEQNIFKELKAKLLAEFPSIGCFTNFKTDTQEFVKNVELNDLMPTEVKNKIEQLNQSVNRFETLYQLLKSDMDQWNISLLFDVQNELKTMVGNLKSINTKFSDLASLINQTPFITKFKPLIKNFNECNDQINEDIDKLKKGVALLFNIQSNYLANKTIGNEIIAFSLDNLPETGFINLKGTGERKNGDELLVEMVLRIPSAVKGVPEQIFTLEQREFTMQLIGPRSEMAVGLIFANPINKEKLNLQNDRSFYYAPTASLLLKFGSKNSYFYNDFLDFGVGLNFSAPDFNTDGTPEFGTGIITTAFKDILSVGINYNVTLDSFYWFFGVSLPFNLPGIPINTIKP